MFAIARTARLFRYSGCVSQYLSYSSFVRDQYGVFPSQLCFNCFRNGTFIAEPFFMERYEAALMWVSDMVAMIEDEKDFRPNLEYFKCRYLCEMNNQCDYYRLSR